MSEDEHARLRLYLTEEQAQGSTSGRRDDVSLAGADIEKNLLKAPPNGGVWLCHCGGDCKIFLFWHKANYLLCLKCGHQHESAEGLVPRPQTPLSTWETKRMLKKIEDGRARCG